MSWNDYRARREILDTVLERARLDSTAAPDLTGLDVERLFGNADNVLLSLEQRWSTQLAARLDLAIEKGISFQVARDELAAELPTLRALLDAVARNSRQLHNAHVHEQRMIQAHSEVQLDTGFVRAIA
ncbi:hypothetical protein [Antrihabitans cavernicola]|uniref:Uncharacterized protein n=1 Tax=Antrihabitans cavernicola TaxID=2495913 RepID=A0A5A7S9J4_9NOCA|nr:hypothetical protein [Spelaeibacter cavernicola]KAA0022154.1 hypothetical protein FOY51_14220 [Spelaeibacter cavernicola]